MALIRALWDAAYLGAMPDFKEAPYDLGSFDEIAHYRGGRAGRPHEFTAGFEVAASWVTGSGEKSTKECAGTATWSCPGFVDT